VGRQVVEEEGETAVNRRVLDNVVVVENEHDLPVLVLDQVVAQEREDRLRRWRLGRLQEGQGGRAQPWLDPLQRGDQIGAETTGLVVGRLERQPGHGGGSVRRVVP
jgi:hypothetical protein